MEQTQDLEKFREELAKIRQDAYKKGEEALSAIQRTNFDASAVIANTLISVIPTMLINVAINNLSQNLTPLMNNKKFLNLDSTYNSVECFPPENERIPLYDENGCLTRVPFPDELKVSPIDQHGTCGVACDD